MRETPLGATYRAAPDVIQRERPVVCRPAQALDCFLRTKMNVLVLGNHFISRASSA
jgi:hypothetical protein